MVPGEDATPPVSAPPDHCRDLRENRTTTLRGAVPVIFRVVSHVVVWVAILVPMFAEFARGWQPFGDEAAIASRSYQALSLHPTLLGMTSAASLNTGHVLFDPGPLMFYLQAVPVHLNSTYGLLWGSAILGGAALSASIEAAWSAGQWMAGAVVAFTALDLLWLTPSVFENLAWNSYFPVPFYMAALVLAWVVALGRVGWWPVLVFVSSVAAQSHLIFLVPAVVLTLVALVLGLIGADRPRRFRWIAIGVCVGVLCWLSPLLQEFGGQGNLTALARSGTGQPTLGIGFGLRLVGDAGALHPLWLTHLPSSFFPLLAVAYGHAPWVGVVILGLLVVITASALGTGHRSLGTFGVVAVAAACGAIASFSVFPVKSQFSLEYLVDCIWVLSVLVWTVVVWGGYAAARWAWRTSHFSRSADEDGWAGTPGTASLPWVAPALTVAALALVGVLGINPAVTRPNEVNWSPEAVVRADRAAQAIERAIPRGPVAIAFGPFPSFYMSAWTAEAVVFRLQTDGWNPGMRGILGSSTGLPVPTRNHWPSVQINLIGIQGFKLVTVR